MIFKLVDGKKSQEKSHGNKVTGKKVTGNKTSIEIPYSLYIHEVENYFNVFSKL